MAEELQLSIESLLYGATDGKLKEATALLKSKIQAGRRGRSLTNTKELERICATIGQGESEEDQAIMKTLDELLVFLKGGPPPLKYRERLVMKMRIE
eukprot:gene10476-11575_t